MNIDEMLARLTQLKAEVGGDAVVFCGEVQSGDRVLASSIDVVSPADLQHPSWAQHLKKDTHTAVEINP